jgi:hypothetical protein
MIGKYSFEPKMEPNEDGRTSAQLATLADDGPHGASSILISDSRGKVNGCNRNT